MKGNAFSFRDEAPAPAQNPLLRVENLCMYFGGVRAVDGLSFQVKKGEIFGLIGPNGAGKTTVFNCITRFYPPTAGQIFFENAEGRVIPLHREKVHNVIRQGVVRTFQNVEVIREITVLENLLVAGHRQYRCSIAAQALHLPALRREEAAVREKALAVLEFMGLSAYRDRYAMGLPYGILKKLEIARTLMCRPRLIILDEPAAGLNDAETAELAELIRRIRAEYDCTILLVEHDMGLIMDICDTVCVISFGRLLAIGTPEEIQRDEGVRTAYLGNRKSGEV
ncbi:MAG: ABC transporter ATP-binding protein [Clostridia bacterium]|nr:ABC transporter ATP-binding protein [Clostridia bacterium]